MPNIFVSPDDDSDDDRLANRILNGDISGEGVFAEVFRGNHPPRRSGWFSRLMGDISDGVVTGSVGRTSNKIAQMQGEAMERAYRMQAEGALVALGKRLAVCLQEVVNACTARGMADNIKTAVTLEENAHQESEKVRSSALPEDRKRVLIEQIENYRDSAQDLVGAEDALKEAKYE